MVVMILRGKGRSVFSKESQVKGRRVVLDTKMLMSKRKKMNEKRILDSKRDTGVT